MRGIHWSWVSETTNNTEHRCFFVVSLSRLWKKQSNYLWFQAPWHSYDALSWVMCLIHVQLLTLFCCIHYIYIHGSLNWNINSNTKSAISIKRLLSYHTSFQIHNLPRLEYIRGIKPSFGIWVVFSFHYLSSVDDARCGAVIWMTWETSIHLPYTHEPPNSSTADSYRVGLRNIISHLGLESPVMRQKENEYLRSTPVGITSTSVCFIISGLSCVKWRCEI